MHLTYLPNAHIGLCVLPEEESAHCVKVLRLQVGSALLVTNGQGTLFHAVLTEAHPKKAVILLKEVVQDTPNESFEVHIAIAPTKNIERIEWFIEKAVEIGIHRVSLFTSFHSERKQVRIDRLEKISIAAMKQSMKLFAPKIEPLVTFDEFLKLPVHGQRFIAYIDEQPLPLLAQKLSPQSNCTILIGPEGDFSKDEIALAIAKGYQPISLGKARLRTETAGLIACATVHFINQYHEKV